LIRRVGQSRGGWGRRLAIGWVVGVAGVPVILLLVWSMAWSWFWPRLLPREWSGRAWQSLLTPASGLWESLGGSLGIATTVALSALAIGLPAARLLARPSFPARRFLLHALLLPVIAPPLASTMGMHALFLRYGLADTYLGVGLAHLVPALPYTILVLTASLTRLDPALEQQARTLGATWGQAWRHVTLPLLLPGLAVAGSFAWLISWSQYLSSWMIGGGQVVTLPLTLVAFQRAGDEPVAAALSLVFLFPPLVVFWWVGRMMAAESARLPDETTTDRGDHGKDGPIR
jgi:putative spermidine/putrescine transport system permease protein